MNRRDFDIDHIDPRWEDGRDYQLVCGLDCSLNYREEDPGRNATKSNRFLPWRWSREDLGVVPEEPGDLALFLVSEEWVLMEFMGEEWFELTRENCGGSKGGYKTSKVWKDQKRHLTNLTNERWLKPDTAVKQSIALKNWAKSNKDKVKERNTKISEKLKGNTKCSAGGSKSACILFKCTETGHVSNAGGLSRYQQARNIDHKNPANRIRL